jgi:uncharacterized protein (TIGR02391 family)
LDLESEISASLWQAITASYTESNYTGAIQDAILALTDLIRTKSGFTADGAALIHQALGGDHPVIKINAFVTDTEQTEQRGVTELLRGFYTGIRNPRSHSKRTDTKKEADAVICFVNYLLGLIDKSKSPFDIEQILGRIFDVHFPSNTTYASLLAGEIPAGKRLEILTEVLSRNSSAKIQNLVLFTEQLVPLCKEEEQSSYYSALSDALLTAKSDGDFYRSIRLAVPYWENCSKLARVRAENHMIESLKSGSYDFEANKLVSGFTGSWAVKLADRFILVDELKQALLAKLESPDREARGYVLKTFMNTLLNLYPEPSARLTLTVRRLIKANDRDVHDALYFLEWDTSREAWIEKFKKDWSAMDVPDDDDIPF